MGAGEAHEGKKVLGWRVERRWGSRREGKHPHQQPEPSWSQYCLSWLQVPSVSMALSLCLELCA